MSCTFSGIRIYPYFRILRKICKIVQRYKFCPKRNYTLLLTFVIGLTAILCPLFAVFVKEGICPSNFVKLHHSYLPLMFRYACQLSLWGSLPVHLDLLPFRPSSLNSCVRGISSFKPQRRRANGEVMRRKR